MLAGRRTQKRHHDGKRTPREKPDLLSEQLASISFEEPAEPFRDPPPEAPDAPSTDDPPVAGADAPGDLRDFAKPSMPAEPDDPTSPDLE